MRSQTDVEKGRTSRQTWFVRVWSPFVIGSIGGAVALLLEAQIASFLGVYSGLLGYLVADLYSGAAIGLVAGLASRTWSGLLTLILGLLAAGVVVSLIVIVTGSFTFGSFPSLGLYLAALLGFFGVPAYAIVAAIASGLRLLRA